MHRVCVTPWHTVQVYESSLLVGQTAPLLLRMTANDPSRQQEAVNHGDAGLQVKAIVRKHNKNIVDFDISDQVERALHYSMDFPRAVR